MIAAGPSFATAPAPQLVLNGLVPDTIIAVAKERALDLHLSEERGVRQGLSFLPNMIVRHDIAPNAIVGLGLASMYTKRKLGSDSRSDGRPGRSRRPAVTFVLKF